MKPRIAIGLSLLLGLCISASSDDAVAKQPQQNSPLQKEQPDATPSLTGKLDDKTRGSNVRAGQLIGIEIRNLKGEEVGTINDLVIDGETGRIQYAAVTYGGFLGVGNKMFAVPFKALTVQVDPKYHDRYVMLLDVSKERLEGAVGFDTDHWPNFADRQFTDELDKRYDVDRAKPPQNDPDSED